MTRRDEGGLRAFDDLAADLESGAISRGNAIKLTGAALAASALDLFASRGANAQSVGLASERGAVVARVVTSAGATGVECVAARVEGASRRAAARMGALVAAEARAATTVGADSGRSRREG